jgi:predicted helicase
MSENDLKIKYNLGKNYAEFILKNKEQLKIENDKFIKCSYRPFDDRYTYFDNKILWRWRVDIMQHFLKGENVGLVTARQCVGDWQYIFCTKLINEFNLTGTAGRFGSGNTFPLYLYPDEKNKDLFETGQERTPNLNMEIVNQIAEKLGLNFVNEKVLRQAQDDSPVTFAPIDLLDYIYAVLHSPTYREKYKEFLKIDFPRVPYPSPLTPKGGIKETQERFWKLVNLGSQIRQIHLLESAIVEKYITQYPIDGNNVVGKIVFEKTSETLGKVYINYDKNIASDALQYFDNVPEVAWNFYIGGYQPAQKWLKDRKDRKLEFEDILHYQKIIVALTETDRLMKEIDKVEIE